MTRLTLSLMLMFISYLSMAQTANTGSSPVDSTQVPDPNDTTIYHDVDIAASFPGGKPAWQKFVGKNLNPTIGIDNGADKGTYKVVIRFTVTKDGTLKDFQPVTHYKHGFEEEVIRVLKLSPKWLPAKKKGIVVNSAVEQLQIFVIS